MLDTLDVLDMLEPVEASSSLSFLLGAAWFFSLSSSSSDKLLCFFFSLLARLRSLRSFFSLRRCAFSKFHASSSLRLRFGNWNETFFRLDDDRLWSCVGAVPATDGPSSDPPSSSSPSKSSANSSKIVSSASSSMQELQSTVLLVRCSFDSFAGVSSSSFSSPRNTESSASLLSCCLSSCWRVVDGDDLVRLLGCSVSFGNTSSPPCLGLVMAAAS
mmetsp:Transcript_15771/g.36173  ORF Transcript_15771/g.36173 Transcript_15771/m.36173 type:complete len:216 (-) Transcript_15771:139-786(-)